MKMRNIFILLLIFPVILFIVLPLHANGPVIILKVIDGDILKVTYGGIKERVRLISIDTPESKISKKELLEEMRRIQTERIKHK